ncbi:MULTISPECIES: LPS export ABC transporter periplasmic protein LptC [unclassified Vibrio]|uniref:Lipopolysaccharide export system protein LptC n=1 Tax=Vibrio sp. HB236076 TaxID=3232307 RepID=A0AB39HFI7_9VIBR|nr:LPS export ABC transporter periplasmic protein LptC [Vibrio sp. HB161653]MDP5255503.1 LPS export ABC transporter periplasmic protein LptC [Vibrio sp. HB161653]
MTLSRPVIIFLVFIASWSAYYLMDRHQDQALQVDPDTELPMFSGESLNNISYNQEGERSYAISSSHLDHYAESGDTIFDAPSLSVYRDGKTIEWTVTAKRAVLDEEHVLTLYDNVQLKNLLPGASFDTLKTQSIEIDLTSKDFHADHEVTLYGPQFNTTSGAMKGNFKDNQATLYNKVQGHYETINP